MPKSPFRVCPPSPVPPASNPRGRVEPQVEGCWQSLGPVPTPHFMAPVKRLRPGLEVLGKGWTLREGPHADRRLLPTGKRGRGQPP